MVLRMDWSWSRRWGNVKVQSKVMEVFSPGHLETFLWHVKHICSHQWAVLATSKVTMWEAKKLLMWLRVMEAIIWSSNIRILVYLTPSPVLHLLFKLLPWFLQAAGGCCYLLRVTVSHKHCNLPRVTQAVCDCDAEIWAEICLQKSHSARDTAPQNRPRCY